MKKSVYSVVLSDEVVAAIDGIAHMQGTNRSALINAVLAQYASLQMPEQQIRDIFDALEELLYHGQRFRLQAPATASVLSMSSALAYKYNPTVRYAVELYKESRGAQGELRVSMRTQNPSLLRELAEFFGYWSAIERAHGFTGRSSYEGGVYRRSFDMRRSGASAERIAAYVNFFDSALKRYFEVGAQAIPELDAAYAAYVQENR